MNRQNSKETNQTAQPTDGWVLVVGSGTSVPVKPIFWFNRHDDGLFCVIRQCDRDAQPTDMHYEFFCLVGMAVHVPAIAELLTLTVKIKLCVLDFGCMRLTRQ